MSDTIINEALRIVQEFGLKVFPCSVDKKPLTAWRHEATSDPDKVRELFSHSSAALVGVPAGEMNDLFVLDLDLYKADESDMVFDFAEELDRLPDVRVHMTKSGGLHYLFLNPKGRKWARNPMGSCEGIGEGFYFIWPTEGSGYSVETDVPMSDLVEPDDHLLTQREKIRGATTTGAMMSSEDADACMRSDGKTASRHDALLRLTHDFVQAIPKDRLGDMPWLSETFSALFREDYADALSSDRMEELLEARQDQHGDWHGELVRALSYPLKLRRAEMGTERMVSMLKGSGEVPIMPAPVKAARRASTYEGEMFGAFTEEDEDTKPWLVRNFMRVEGSGAIIGQSGVGKTTLTALWVAAFIDGQAEVAGFPEIDRPLNVAWMNAEEEAADLNQHVREAQRELGLRPNGTLITMGEEILDRHEEGISLVIKKRDPELNFTDLVVNMPLVNKIADEIRSAGIDLLIADPITEFNDGNENDRSDAKKLNRAFKLIAQKAGVAVLYWAHTGKPPEGKRPDWHRDDQFSQRGSSQNIGAVKTSGTLTPCLPPGKADEAQSYYAKSRDHDRFPEVPNIVRMKLLKVKKCPARLDLYYDIKPGSRDRDIPVAHYVDSQTAVNMTAAAEDKDRRMKTLQIGQILIDQLGNGTHNRTSVNREMEGIELPGGTVWAKDAKASTKKWSAILSLFSEPVKIDKLTISATFEEGETAFEVYIR